MGGSLEDGREHGRGIHRGKRGTSGCGPPPFWQREPVETAGWGGDGCKNGKGAISGAAGADADWPIELPLVFWLSSRKTVEHATADQNPRTRPCPQRRNAGLLARHSTGAPQFQ